MLQVCGVSTRKCKYFAGKILTKLFAMLVFVCNCNKNTMEKIREVIENGKPFEIKVVTKSSMDRIYWENDGIKVKIREIPEDGKANRAIIALFSKTFKIQKKNIVIIKGERSSNKTIKIEI